MQSLWLTKRNPVHAAYRRAEKLDTPPLRAVGQDNGEQAFRQPQPHGGLLQQRQQFGAVLIGLSGELGPACIILVRQIRPECRPKP
jgi:hypothetical protein